MLSIGMPYVISILQDRRVVCPRLNPRSPTEIIRFGAAFEALMIDARLLCLACSEPGRIPAFGTHCLAAMIND